VPFRSLQRLYGPLAAALFSVTVLVMAVLLPGFSHARHPLALLGASGVAHASLFNVLGFIVPGALATLAAVQLRHVLPASAGLMPRVGVQMLVLAGLAFALMGLAPLDPEDLDGRASQLHAAAWMIWVLAFAGGAGLFGTELRGGRVLAWGCSVFAVLAAFALPDIVPQPVAQRGVFGCWVVWLALSAGWRPLRTTA